MVRFWLTAAAAALASAAIAYAAQSSMSGNMLLSQFVPLPLFLAGLSMGATAGAVAGIGATAALVPFVGIVGAGAFFVTLAAPTAILLRQALLWRETEDGSKVWYPAGPLIAVLAGIGVVLALLAPGLLAMQENYEALLQAWADMLVQMIKADERAFFLEVLRRTVPPATTLGWMLTLFISGGVAQWILARSESNLRPTPDFLAMRLPDWVATVAAAAGIAVLVAPGWATSYVMGVLVALCLPFFLQGLALVHAFNRKIGGGFALVLIFYVVLALQIWPAVLVLVLGVVEQFVRLRRRWDDNTHNHGSAS